MHLAEAEGWSGEETLKAADDLGFDWRASSIGSHFEEFAKGRKKG